MTVKTAVLAGEYGNRKKEMTFAIEPNTIICPTYGHPRLGNYMQAIYIVKIVETLAVKGVRQKHGFLVSCH